MVKWKEVPFESIYLEPSKNGINRPSNTRGTGFKMINMGELFKYERINNPMMELVPLNDEEKNKYGVVEGDLLFARQSLVAEGAGKCSIVLSVPETTCFEGHLIRVRLDKSKANPLFYFYYFLSYEGKGRIKSLVMQVAAAGIRGSELAKLNIPHPSLATQRRIADILSAYDDLIENNTRRIRILEQMAQAIYQEWFGKVDKESLPKEWELKPFSELVDIDPATPVDKEIEKPFIGMNALSETSMIIDLSLAVMRNGNSGAKFQNRDVLFPRITPSVENGKGAFVQFLKDGQVSIGSTEIIVFREKELNAEYIYFLSREHEFRGNAINSMVGASGRQRVQQKCFDSFMVAKPPKKLLEKFADVVSPMFKITHTLAMKNANLRQTRDLLLPRLVSGEIPVHE